MKNGWPGVPQFAIFQHPVSEVTVILEAIEQGDRHAAEKLLPLVYDELRRLAAFKMAGEADGQTLQPTALVHEAWIRLAGSTRQQWQNRRHFVGAAAEAMRRILIDRARSKHRPRHGHGLQRLNLDDVDLAATADDDALLRVNEALLALEREAPDRAELVKLRYFAGLSIAEAAEMLGISPATAKRQWTFARAWLYRVLQKS
ncbi:MAG TPA: ECF-type sigma factor [Verrucomicrobiae bacterium]|nr:ECF-type sigma factor [Verrucomicrobiae bacterium]